jgi:hypothetical protein
MLKNNYKKTLTPTRDNQFLIDGLITSIDHSKELIEISLLIDMDKNFKDSSISSLSKNFLVKKDVLVYVAGPKRKDPLVFSNGLSQLKEGDLLALEVEESVKDILSRKTFFAIKLWKIIMTQG